MKHTLKTIAIVLVTMLAVHSGWWFAFFVYLGIGAYIAGASLIGQFKKEQEDFPTYASEPDWFDKFFVYGVVGGFWPIGIWFNLSYLKSKIEVDFCNSKKIIFQSPVKLSE